MTCAARNFRSTMRTKADPVRNPAQAILSFMWGAFNVSYAYARVFLEPEAGTIRFSGTNVTNNPAYARTLTYRDASTEDLAMERTIPILDNFHAITGGNLAKGWHLRVRTHPNGTLPIFRDVPGDVAQTTNAWLPWDKEYQIFNFRPSTTQIDTYCYLDFSMDGGATTAFTIECARLLSTSSG
jgi:hypothetical protein